MGWLDSAISDMDLYAHKTENTASNSQATFNGADWQNLNRLVILTKLAALQDDDLSTPKAKCGYLAARYTGPALDWVASAHASNPALLDNFETFIERTREAFGIADNNITALLRRELDQLQWNIETPVFFAEFDRLTMALGISSHETRVAMVEQKLPHTMKKLLAEQCLSFANYDTMRERFNGMWAMDPTRNNSVTHPNSRKKKPRCGNCGKKGHSAPECKGAKN